jgi:hypothetical protein
LISRQLKERYDIEYRYVRAWEPEPDEDELGAGTDLLLIGRPRLFSSSLSLAGAVTKLEGQAYGKFIDKNSGRTGVAVAYNKRVFKRLELEEQAADYRRYSQDYGLLLCRRDTLGGEERWLIALAGLGILGTLGLVTILSDGRMLQTLVQQVQDFAPLDERHLPEKHIEIVVKIEAGGHERLIKLLNTISKQGEEAFSFHAEAVAVATTEGKPDIRFSETATARPRAVVLDLKELETQLSYKRRELLRHLINKEGKATPDALCVDLGFVPGGRKKQPSNRERGRLAKLVHDLNEDLLGRVTVAGAHTRIIRFEHGHYILQGIQS